MARATSPARPHRCYGAPPPGVDLEGLHGHLFVIEGPDGSGRTTQIALLKEWLESEGHAVVDVGLKRSSLVASDIDHAMSQHTTGPTTLALFYATDFADQLDQRIVPALRAGFVVLADRYIYSLMARAIVRGAQRRWIESVYQTALVPDHIFYLQVEAPHLVARVFAKSQGLDYWESGGDLGLGRDLLQSFTRYQRKIQAEFMRMQNRYAFEVVDGNRSVTQVNYHLRRRIASVLGLRLGKQARETGLPMARAAESA